MQIGIKGGLIMLLLYKGIVFDDYNIDENGNIWSQICADCLKKFKGIEHEVDEFGSGICGVRGCTNDSIHYIDFDSQNVSLFDDDE